MAIPARVQLVRLALCLQRFDLRPFRGGLLVAHHHYPNVPGHDLVQRANQRARRDGERKTTVDVRYDYVLEIGSRSVIEQEDNLAIRP